MPLLPQRGKGEGVCEQCGNHLCAILSGPGNALLPFSATVEVLFYLLNVLG